MLRQAPRLVAFAGCCVGLAAFAYASGCAQGSTDGLGGEEGTPEVDGSVVIGRPSEGGPSGPDGPGGPGGGDGGDGGDGAGPREPKVDAGCSNKIVVNEIKLEGTTASADEFVELYNPNSCVVAVGGWNVVVRTRGGGNPVVVYQFPAGARLEPGAFFVLGGPAFGGPKNVTYTHTLDASGTQIGIVDEAGGVIDGVGCGDGATGVFVEGAPAAAPPGGQSLGRKAGADTNSNISDFRTATPTPGAANL